MSDLDTLYDRNEEFSRTFDQGDLPILPRRPTIVLTCVDSRVDPAHFLGLELGDTLVMRNSGGRVTDDVEQGVALLAGMTRLVAGDRASASVRPRPPPELVVSAHLYDVRSGRVSLVVPPAPLKIRKPLTEGG